MKVVTLILFWAFIAAAQIPQTEENIWANARNLSGINFKSLDELRTAPAESAWKFFRRLCRPYAYDQDKVAIRLLKQAGRTIAENESVGELVRERLAKLSHEYSNTSERESELLPLANISAPWSLRLLGEYLMDDRPLTGPVEDYGGSANSALALIALSRMGFSDAPTTDYLPNVTPTAEKAWREWWKTNEGRVEQRIYEINPGYVPPQMQQPPTTATPIQTPISTPQVAPATPSSTTPKPTAALLPRATPAIVTPVNHSSLFIYIIGTVLVLGILFAVIKAFRK